MTRRNRWAVERDRALRRRSQLAEEKIVNTPAMIGQSSGHSRSHGHASASGGTPCVLRHVKGADPADRRSAGGARGYLMSGLAISARQSSSERASSLRLRPPVPDPCRSPLPPFHADLISLDRQRLDGCLKQRLSVMARSISPPRRAALSASEGTDHRLARAVKVRTRIAIRGQGPSSVSRTISFFRESWGRTAARSFARLLLCTFVICTLQRPCFV